MDVDPMPDSDHLSQSAWARPACQVCKQFCCQCTVPPVPTQWWIGVGWAVITEHGTEFVPYRRGEF